jgi:5'-methylthioadenosine phosphorylase
VAHVAFAHPLCPVLSTIAVESAERVGATVHRGGTYVCMEGPQFSTVAESNAYRQWGMDVIGMTNLGEAKCAREAEIAYATMAMVTDYDCWKVEEEPVSVQTVFGHLIANAETAKKILALVVPKIPSEPNWPEHRALDSALVTDRGLWPAETVEKLRPILGRFLAE